TSSQSDATSWGIASLAIVLASTVLALPAIVKDDSCHNLFRDGRTSVGPQIAADIHLNAEDCPKLARIFVALRSAPALAFRGDQQIRDGTSEWRDLNLCNEAGVNIDALDDSRFNQVDPDQRDAGIELTVYELKAGSGWDPLARDLLQKIDAAWPGK